MIWLQQAAENLSLSESTLDYLLGRGGSTASIEAMGLGEWNPLSSDIPDKDFSYRYGIRGEKLEGYLTVPIRTVRGELLGFEFRSMREKHIFRFLSVPKSNWNPVWIMHPESPQKIWDGGSVWIVEGVFDLLPMEWVVPPQDAVLASIRAGLTRKHVDFLQSVGTPRVHMVYDRDAAGRTATQKALKMLGRSGIPSSRVSYVGGKDPGEIWDSAGKNGLLKAFKL